MNRVVDRRRRSDPAALGMRALQAGLRARPDSRVLRSLGFRFSLMVARDDRPLHAPLRCGGAMLVDPRDASQREILLTGETEPGTTALLTRIATPGWTFLDVGANAGYYSLLAATLGGTRSSVHAFEPNPRMAALIEQSLRMSGDDCPVTVVCAGCGSDSGAATLYLSPDPSLVAFATLDAELAWSDGWERLDVTVVTLDGYCRQHALAPDVIKIDAEGFEPLILEGMHGLLGRSQPSHVICEAITGYGRPDPDLLVRMMGRFSYSLAVIGDDGALRPPEGRGPVSGNVCFVRPDEAASTGL